jgi:hypothetical protein
MHKLGVINFMNAQASTGVGSTISLTRQGVKTHTVQVFITGGPSDVVIELQGSIDGSNWFTLAEHTFSAAELSASQAMFHVTGRLVHHVRPNLTTLTGGTSPAVTADYTGDANATA